MKKVFLQTSLFALLLSLFACGSENGQASETPQANNNQSASSTTAENATTSASSANTAHDSPIKWMTWEEAVAANEQAGKRIFIDFYTDWCGWCKRMDKTTFADAEVARYINENFLPVKFNAEQKEDIVFRGTTFKFQPGGRSGVHMLAAELLNGRLGYPSYVYLTPEYERILISPGYKQVPEMKKELEFIAEGHYATTSWDAYRQTN